jgi:hypothetical protein
MDARHRREAHNVLHGENQRALDQAMDHQPVPVRIDIGPSRMMALEKQAVRRDDAVQILQRRKADGRFGPGGEPWHVAPDDAGLSVGGSAIGPVHHAGADRLRPRRVRGRGSRRGFRFAWLRSESKGAGQRRAQTKKGAPAQRILRARELRYHRDAAS